MILFATAPLLRVVELTKLVTDLCDAPGALVVAEAAMLEIGRTLDAALEAGVEQISVTEQFGKGADGNLVRVVVSAFNEHQSAETSKHTRRTMRANAADAFWNGDKVPFGFRSVTVEVRGTKEKKRLAIDEDEAAVVRLMYDLAINVCGKTPMGARDIATWLNARGYTLKAGKFHDSNVADILARTRNIGHYLDGKTSELSEPLSEPSGSGALPGYQQSGSLPGGSGDPRSPPTARDAAARGERRHHATLSRRAPRHGGLWRGADHAVG